MKLQEIKERLNVDTISKKEGVITVRRGYYYTMGKSAKDLELRVKAAYPKATILSSGDHYTRFSGGAPTHQQSHWWVKFTLMEKFLK